MVRRASIESLRFHKNHALIRFHDISDRTAAEELRGAEIAIMEHDRPDLEEGAFYYDDLVGLRVVDATTEDTIGTVKAVIYGTHSEYLEIKFKDKHTTFLMPFVEEIVKDVDLEKGCIAADIPPGLIDHCQT